MATVREVLLRVDTQPDAQSARVVVSVSYKVDFDPWERQAWFREFVAIAGLVDGDEKDLAYLTADPFIPADLLGSATERTITRTTAPITFVPEQLDVAPPIAVTDGLVTLIVARRDDLFARVSITPVLPSAHTGQSPIVSNEFETATWGQA